MIPESCMKCSFDPALKETWNCDDSPQAVVERIPDDNGTTHEYYNCPLRWVTPNTVTFIDRYVAIKNGLAAPVPYEEESAWFNTCVRYYEKWVNIWIKKKREK